MNLLSLPLPLRCSCELASVCPGLTHFNIWSLFFTAPAVLPLVMVARDLARSFFSISGLHILLACVCSSTSSLLVQFVLRGAGVSVLAVSGGLRWDAGVVVAGYLAGLRMVLICGETVIERAGCCCMSCEGVQPRCCSRFLIELMDRWVKLAWRSARWSFFNIPSLHSSFTIPFRCSSSSLLHILLFFCRSSNLSSFTSSGC